MNGSTVSQTAITNEPNKQTMLNAINQMKAGDDPLEFRKNYQMAAILKQNGVNIDRYSYETLCNQDLYNVIVAAYQADLKHIKHLWETLVTEGVVNTQRVSIYNRVLAANLDIANFCRAMRNHDIRKVVADAHQAIEQISTQLPENDVTTKQQCGEFKTACLDYYNELVKQLIKEHIAASEKRKIFNSKASHAYELTQDLAKLVNELQATNLSKDYKLFALKQYEDQVRKKPSNWERFKKSAKQVLITGVGAVIGGGIGAAIGLGVFSVPASIVGAAIGAAIAGGATGISTHVFFNKTSKVEKRAAKVAKVGEGAIQIMPSEEPTACRSAEQAPVVMRSEEVQATPTDDDIESLMSKLPMPPKIVRQGSDGSNTDRYARIKTHQKPVRSNSSDSAIYSQEDNEPTTPVNQSPITQSPFINSPAIPFSTFASPAKPVSYERADSLISIEFNPDDPFAPFSDSEDEGNTPVGPKNSAPFMEVAITTNKLTHHNNPGLKFNI